MGHEPPPILDRECSNCDANRNYPRDGVVPIHFVDYATDIELNEERYFGFNQKPKAADVQTSSIKEPT